MKIKKLMTTTIEAYGFIINKININIIIYCTGMTLCILSESLILY